MRIHFSSGYSVQSHRGKVWHSCAFGSWWESLLLDFHSWKKKIISWCPQISWCTRGRERRWAVSREWAWAWVCGLIFLLARWVSRGLPTQGASREAPQDTGLQSPSWGQAPPALRQPPPQLTTPYTDLTGLEAVELMDTSSLGNKEKQRIRPRGGRGPSSPSSTFWAVIGCGENLWKMPKSCPSEQNSPLFFLNTFFFFATVMFFQMILSGVEFGICSFWTYLKMACFPLANDYLFLWKTDKIFFLFWIQLSPSERTSDWEEEVQEN